MLRWSLRIGLLRRRLQHCWALNVLFASEATRRLLGCGSDVVPILNVKVSAARSPALTTAIAEMLLQHTSRRILRTRRDLIAIAIDYVSSG